MIVKLRHVAGADFEVEVDGDTDIESFKAIVLSMHEEFGDDPDAMRLVYRGHILKDGSATLDGLGFKEGEIMHMTMARQQAAAAAAPAPAAPAAAAAVAPGQAGAVGGVMGPPPQDLVQTLMAMGFPQETVVAALHAAFNNGDRAIEYLLSGNIPPPPAEEASAPAAAAAGAAAAGGGSWPEAVLGAQLLTKSGLQPTAQALGSPAVVLVYFSAHWCPPCRGFTPQLARAFSALGEQPHIRVVFASSDRSPQDFQAYYNEMPWLALPFGDPRTQMLSRQFQVQGIPTVVALDGSSGRVLDPNARGAIQNSGFDLAATCRSWGKDVPSAPAPKTVMEEVAASAPSGTQWPKVEKIDVAAAKAVIQRVEALEDAKQAAFRDTVLKLLENVLSNPQEAKFRTIKKTNKTLSEKVFSEPEGAGVELFKLAGFQDEAEVTVLPGPPDGRAHAVWEVLARSVRDAKLAKVLDEEKKRPPERSFGGEGGRHSIGKKPARGGGG